MYFLGRKDEASYLSYFKLTCDGFVQSAGVSVELHGTFESTQKTVCAHRPGLGNAITLHILQR